MQKYAVFQNMNPKILPFSLMQIIWFSMRSFKSYSRRNVNFIGSNFNSQHTGFFINKHADKFVLCQAIFVKARD